VCAVRRRDRERAAVLGVEQLGEHRRRVEAWHAAPDDRAIASDMGCELTVSDEAKLG
jgi:hypothetical protein